MNIALIGYGKMGKSIEEEILSSHPEWTISQIFTESNVLSEATDLNEIDIAIEFTNPESAPSNIMLCLNKSVPVVSGTTGIETFISDLERLPTQQNISLVYSRNFSVGITLLSELVQWFVEKTKHLGFDIELSETHHVHKVDKPSGTAIQLAKAILQKSPEFYTSFGLKEEDANISAGVLPITSIRLGEVVGEHEIKFSSSLESITIKHEALDRKLFSKGVVKASEWLIGKRGIFTMRDVLGF